MTFIYNDYVKLSYKDKTFRCPTILISLLMNLKKKNDNKFDSVIVVTGAVGTGKSTMAQALAGIWQMLHKKELTIDHFTWSAKGVIDFIDRKDNELEPIIFDEAIKGGTGRDALTKEGNLLKVGLVVGRRKRHLYIMLVDELQEFNKKIISRARILIDMRTMFVKAEEIRGYFKIYNQLELKEMYWLLKEQKIKYIHQYHPDKPFYRIPDLTNIFINEDEYENKKIEETRQQEDNKGVSITDKEKQILTYLLYTKKSQMDIANALGVDASYVSKVKRKFKNDDLVAYN